MICSRFEPRKEATANSTANESRWNKVRISPQGSIPMETWDQSAKWLEKLGRYTLKSRELKPDLMSLVAENNDGKAPIS